MNDTPRCAMTYAELTEAFMERCDAIERVRAQVRPLGILYAALPDGLYARRCKAILDDLRAALEED